MRRSRLAQTCGVWLVGAMWLLGMPLASAQTALPDTLLWEPVGDVHRGRWLAFHGDTLYAGVEHMTGAEFSQLSVLSPNDEKWTPTGFRWTAQDLVFMPNGTAFFYSTALVRSTGIFGDYVDVHDEVRFMLPIETPEGALLVGLSDNSVVVARSTDDGVTWIDHGGPQVAAGGMSPLDLLVLPPTAARATHRIVAVGYGGILISDDDGRTWHPSAVYAQQWAFTAWAGVRIASGPYDGGHGGELLAVIEGNGGGSVMARSSDGITWEAVAPFPGQARYQSDLLALPDGTVFLYERIGDNDDQVGRTLWRTADGGESWQAVGPVWREWTTVPTDLAIGPDGRLWASASANRGHRTNPRRGGVFRTVEPVYVTSQERPTLVPVHGQVTANPNPSRQRVELALSGLVRSRADVVVVDPQGREVARREVATGSSWRLDVSGWAPGVYHARIVGGPPGVGVAFTVVR